MEPKILLVYKIHISLNSTVVHSNMYFGHDMIPIKIFLPSKRWVGGYVLGRRNVPIRFGTRISKILYNEKIFSHVRLNIRH